MKREDGVATENSPQIIGAFLRVLNCCEDTASGEKGTNVVNSVPSRSLALSLILTSVRNANMGIFSRLEFNLNL